MNAPKNTRYRTWTTDDNRFMFSFKIEISSPGMDSTIWVSIRYISPSLNQKTLWEDLELFIDDKALIFAKKNIDGLCVKGSIKAFLTRNGKDGNLVIWGDFKHGVPDSPSHFIGPMAIEKIVVIAPVPPPPPHPTPPPPPQPQPPQPVGPVIEPGEASAMPTFVPDTYHDLFPFILLSHWPNIDRQAEKSGFVRYKARVTSPPTATFSDHLATLKKAGNRSGMLEEAEKLMANKAPYQGIFVAGPKDLKGMITRFPDVMLDIEISENCNMLLMTICRILDAGIEAIDAYLKSNAYIIQRERLWQTYFALIIKMGLYTQWLNYISGLLITCNLLEELFFNITAEKEDIPFDQKEIWELSHATLLLPESIFPLPPFAAPLGKENPAPHVKCYAIGSLQLVKQKLLRYETGEIANIISVMPGEKKESTNRKLHQETNQTNYTEVTQNTNQQTNQEANSDLANEVIKTLAHSKDTFTYNDYSTNYGAPTSITLSGSYTVEKECPEPEQVKASRFAKKIISETSANIRKQITHQRKRRINHELEETSLSVLDNTGNTNAVYGTYYWLNKVYEARLVNYGTRLMLSFLIPNPSEPYIKAEFNFKNEKLIEPKSPGELFQIFSFNDINTDNYTQICAYYDVENFELPPDELKVVSGILEGTESKFMEIPQGYEADIAYVTYISDQGQAPLKVNGLVGRQEFTFTGTTGTFKPLKLSKEDISIPISATGNQPLLSPPAMAKTFRVNIEAECTCSNRRLNEWKQKLYHQVMQKYKEQRTAYFNNLNSNVQMNKNNNPLYKRKTIKKAFKKSCIKQLVNHMTKLKGTPPAPPKEATATFETHNPYFINFLSNAIEWNEMTYYLLEDFGSDVDYSGMEMIAPDDENIFNAFLQAEAARIMVPVWPEFNYAVIFFLSTGSIWRGLDKLAPTVTGQAALVYELKHIQHHQKEGFSTPECWEFRVPTSLQILSNSPGINQTPEL